MTRDTEDISAAPSLFLIESRVRVLTGRYFIVKHWCSGTAGSSKGCTVETGGCATGDGAAI